MTAAGLLALAVLVAALVAVSCIGLGFARALWRLEGEHASKCEALAKAECAESKARIDLAWERARVADLQDDARLAHERLASLAEKLRQPTNSERVDTAPAPANGHKFVPIH